jgi:predicted exporter
LAGSAVTTLIGFSLLATSSLPLLRQTGVFICAGVITAAATALLWFAQVRTPEGQTRLESPLAPDDGPGRTSRRGISAILVVIAAVALLGPWRLHWHDDIRELEIRSPELWDNDRAVRALFGDGGGRSLMLTRGNDIAEARASLERLRQWLREEEPEARLASVGLALPLASEHAAAPGHVQELGSFEADLRAALEARGYEVELFEPFFSAWRALQAREARPDYGALVQDFVHALRGPVAMALQSTPGTSWFAVVIENGPAAAPPADTATVSAGQLETLNHLFTRYRQSALWLSLIGLALVTTCVLAVFGVRRGLRMAAVPVGASLFVFGLYGLAGQTLNLFHLLGAFLAVAMTVDYAIFAGDSATRGHGLPPSVRLSALTTVTSFGVLGFSAIPVVAALGVTVALIIASGWGLVELLTRLERG